MQTAKEKYRELVRNHIGPHFEQKGWKRSGYLCRYDDPITGNALGLDVKTYGVNNDDRVVMWFYISIFPIGFLEITDKSSSRSDREVPVDVSRYVVPFDNADPVGQIEKNIFWELKKEDDVTEVATEVIERLDLFYDTLIGVNGEHFKDIVKNFDKARELEGHFFTNQTTREFREIGVRYSIISLSDEVHGKMF